MSTNGKGRRHPLIGQIPDDPPLLKRPSARRRKVRDGFLEVDEVLTSKETTTVGMIWDEDAQEPVPPPAAPPPVSVAQAAEEAEPGFGKLLRKVGSALLIRLARKLDPDG